MPQPCDGFSNTNIIGLKGVQGNTQGQGAEAESPHSSVANQGYSLLREIVDDTRPVQSLVLLFVHTSDVVIVRLHDVKESRHTRNQYASE